MLLDQEEVARRQLRAHGVQVDLDAICHLGVDDVTVELPLDQRQRVEAVLEADLRQRVRGRALLGVGAGRGRDAGREPHRARTAHPAMGRRGAELGVRAGAEGVAH
jgi:hypothetical protein